MPALMEEGRAKVNLTLRVVGRRVDGYHDLESVVAFADCADRLSLTPGESLDLKTIGPLANDCGESADNLVLKAAQLLGERVPGLRVGEFVLDKVLPVAAGIGGGSADAAAALRLLARLNGLAFDDPRLMEVALLTGADVPVCLASRACDMTGVGETLLPLSLPELPCVMVNPRVAIATRDVFRGARPAQRRIAGRRHRRDPGRLLAGSRRVDGRLDRGAERRLQRPRSPGDADSAGHRRGADGPRRGRRRKARADVRIGCDLLCDFRACRRGAARGTADRARSRQMVGTRGRAELVPEPVIGPRFARTRRRALE